jgi:isoleucyl-tRNA synthetase
VFVGTDDAALLAGIDFAEACITSAITVTTDAPPADAFRLPDVAGVAVVPALASGEKCQRCWQVLPEVSANPDRQPPERQQVCRRCADALKRRAA